MDRKIDVKLHMEDMCQLLERLTEDKYKSLHEQVAKVIRRYGINPGLDLVRFYELTLFSFLTGNSDMHLKNFSLIKNENGHYELAPAYDLVATALVVEGDDEELALTLTGKKKRLRKSDFFKAMTSSGLPYKAAENILNKYAKLSNSWLGFVNQSFLSNEMKERHRGLIKSKHHQLYD